MGWFEDDNIENEDFSEPASGVYSDISSYLEDKFNAYGDPNGIKIKQPASGFDLYLQDRFRE